MICGARGVDDVAAVPLVPATGPCALDPPALSEQRELIAARVFGPTTPHPKLLREETIRFDCCQLPTAECVSGPK